MSRKFVFEYEAKDGKRKKAAVWAKHLQGAIRRLYTERSDLETLTRILKE